MNIGTLWNVQHFFRKGDVHHNYLVKANLQISGTFSSTDLGNMFACYQTAYIDILGLHNSVTEGNGLQ